MELSVDRLTKHYGRKIAVDCVSTVLTPGVYGLLGENGAGKTTFMRMLCAILESTSGEVFLDGREITSMGADYRDVLGYLPQEFSVYPGMRVGSALDYLGILSEIPRNIRKERIRELLKQTHLEQEKNKRFQTLSGGMKCRFGIAQALLNHPGLLILDEPTAGLDQEERARFYRILSELAGDRIILLSTHIDEDIEAVCPRAAVLSGGRMIFEGETSEWGWKKCCS